MIAAYKWMVEAGFLGTGINLEETYFITILVWSHIHKKVCTSYTEQLFAFKIRITSYSLVAFHLSTTFMAP
jgi:hypothetical protein